MFYEIQRNMEKRGLKVLALLGCYICMIETYEYRYKSFLVIIGLYVQLWISNPRMEVMEKFVASKFINMIGKESIYISVDKAVEACRFNLHETTRNSGSPNVSNCVEDGAYIEDDGKLNRCSFKFWKGT